MDPEQLWETTLDPERRVLKRVEIEDARMASEVTEMLMGSEVPPRRQFIYDHANEAEIDAVRRGNMAEKDINNRIFRGDAAQLLKLLHECHHCQSHPGRERRLKAGTAPSAL